MTGALKKKRAHVSSLCCALCRATFVRGRAKIVRSRAKNVRSETCTIDIGNENDHWNIGGETTPHSNPGRVDVSSKEHTLNRIGV